MKETNIYDVARTFINKTNTVVALIALSMVLLFLLAIVENMGNTFLSVTSLIIDSFSDILEKTELIEH